MSYIEIGERLSLRAFGYKIYSCYFFDTNFINVMNITIAKFHEILITVIKPTVEHKLRYITFITTVLFDVITKYLTSWHSLYRVIPTQE